MTDFFQNGNIATFHNLTNRPVEELEYELAAFARTRKLCLVLPSLYSELERPALTTIVEELQHATYIDKVVIGLDRATAEQYRHAVEFFSVLPQRHWVLWNDGPRMRDLRAQLEEEGLTLGEPGKGRNTWGCYAFLLGMGGVDAVALHDCDITTYERGLLARLMYPVANPGFGYEFCKGYYARVGGDKLNGRVARLLVTPLIRSFKIVLGSMEFLDYLDSFRYPLAGEMSLRASALPDLRIPSDWGLEVGLLSEMYRNLSSNRICQVDIADNYDHKHQDVSSEDKTKGLHRMAIEICKALFRKLATMGTEFNSQRVRTLKATYLRQALDFVDRYHNEAILNGLRYDRHIEEQAVELFAGAIVEAGAEFERTPHEAPFIPSINRVCAAIPDFLHQLTRAAREDLEDLQKP